MNQVTSDKFRWMAFLSSIMIAMSHATKIVIESGETFVMLCNQLAVPAMVYFFLSSAYFHYREYEKSDYVTKLKKRIGTLLVPYVCWNLTGYFLAVRKQYTTLSVINLAKGMIFVYIPIINREHEPIVGALWFIMRLLSFEIAAPVFMWLIRHKRLFWLVVTSSIFMVIFYDVNYYAFLYWMPFYLIGAYIAYYYHEKVEEILSYREEKFNWKCLVCLIVFLLYGIYCMECRAWEFTYDMERFCAIPLIFVCMYLINWYPKVNWIVKHNSFYLYCIHVPLIWIFGNWVIRRYDTIYSVNKMYLILVGIILGISWSSQWILHKAFPKLEVFLSGKR